MSAQIIPFPMQPRVSATIGSLEQESERLAVLVHARAIESGRPSTYEQALAAVNIAVAEVFE